MLAQARLHALFEQTYGAIFGTQLVGLRKLNEVGGVTAVEKAKEFFEKEVRARSPELLHAGVTFDQWMAFLIGQGLVRLSADSIEITNIGREFLEFVSARGGKP